MLIVTVIAAVAALMILAERCAPGRTWPRVSGWLPRALALNAVQGVLVIASGIACEGWLARHSVRWGERLGIAGGALAGYVAITFVYYWWHRWRHESDFLWRWLHQVHHSPRRLEVVTSFYKHPFEMLVNSVLPLAVLYLVLGVSRPAAGGALFLTGLAELFYHWNVRTPYWLGFIIQRPEAHCVHHQSGHHAQNYADLPIWDICFGTFANPRAWDGACGFTADEEARLDEMLAGAVVTAKEDRR